MHDLLRDLCLREAEKDKFLCVTKLQSPNNLSQDINTQRRIAIHRCTLRQEKVIPETYDAFQYAPLARSLINISLKIFPPRNFRLSRVLKIFYNKGGRNLSLEFPFHLVNLRYLAVTARRTTFLNYKIPSSVHLPWNLQTLIGDNGQTSNVDIWKMPLLQHVKLMRLYLGDPDQDSFVLENLQTLSRIENFKFGEEVVKRIPNIQKLKFSYNIYALTASHYCLNNLGHLHKLESLNCSFRPEPSWSDLMQNLMFPHSLKKLTLRNCNIHWRDISTKIGSLPHLQVLKLGWNSLMGHEWETVEGQFVSLKYLKFWGIELKHWTTEASHFPRLEHLFLDNLWNLKDIPLDIGNIPTLKLIELHYCSKAALFSAKEIAEEQNDLGNQDLQVRVCNAYNMPYEEIKRMVSHNFLLDI